MSIGFGPGRALALGLAATVLLPLQAAAAPLGSDLEELLDVMEHSHPALTAAAASRDAAAAEIEIAGALPDPQFQASFEDIDRKSGSPLPDRLGSIHYNVDQTFPLGGKRTLRRDVAKADLTAVATERNQTLLDLTAEMKKAFAQHYLAVQTTTTIDEEGKTLRDLAEIAKERYAQGLGRQQEAIEAEAELPTLDITLADAERDRTTAVGRINALIGQPVDSPLAVPSVLPPVPDVSAINVSDLISRAEERSPALAARSAAIQGATASNELASRNWYPDVTVGVSLVDQDRDLSGYEARIGFNIPLQWGLRQAQQGQARAKLAEAKARAAASRVELSGNVVEALQKLRAASAREAAIRTKQLPRLEEAVEAAKRAYAVDQADLADAIGTTRRLKEAEIEHIGMLYEQQALLAELERLAGGSL
ncbi:MAG TPA: TolC family protein [Dongiaceae bacterium]|jgi:outer membrane protein TolC|nr:TolC family protein [Dongiaceae bacterium]